jgi:hypothetical protein
MTCAKPMVANAAAILLLTSAQSADAATGSVPFTGIVTAACVLTVGTPGVLGTSADFTTMSSASSGGSPGTIAALATGAAFRVSAIAPSDFTTAPAGGGTGTTFTASYAGSGATSIGSTPGATTTLLAPGLTNLSINLAAHKTTGVFSAGAYVAEVLVRCE